MILFAVYSVAQIRICEEFARRLPEGQRFGFLSFNDDTSVNAQLNQLAIALGASFTTLRDLGNRLHRDGIAQRWRRFRANQKFRPISVNQTYFDLLTRQVLACEEYIRKNAIDLVIVCEDGPGGCAPLIEAAKRRHVLVADMPFGIGEMREYEIFLDKKAEEGNLNLVLDDATGAAIRSLAPHWVKKTQYGPVTLFPSDFVLARIASGLDIPVPWAVHGGNADVLLVESRAMERIYARERVPTGKRVLTGSCYADVIYDELSKNRDLRRAYDSGELIEQDRPHVLVALPPSYHGEPNSKSEFPTYRETIERLLEGCRAAHPRVRITVSLHPATTPDARDVVYDLVDEVSSDWLLRLIPRNDVFVSVFSSTIRWALMCGKPVVNYDMYGFGYRTYDNQAGFFTTCYLNKAITRLRDTVESREGFRFEALKLKASAHEWGIMDGSNFDRIWSFLEQRKLEHSSSRQSRLSVDFSGRVRNFRG